MTEDQIERAVEHMFDVLDYKLMRGKLTQEQYDAEAKAIHDWSEREEKRNGVY